MKASATAHPNIALVKYWGKRNEELILPHNGSLSMTLEGLSATTTVEFSDREEDLAQIDGRRLEGSELKRIVRILDLVRERAGLSKKARVASRTDFPKAAGLASSAAGGAALAAATSWAAGLELSVQDLSILARHCSGSACRSIEGGFCEWKKGSREDGLDSYAVQILGESDWADIRMVVVICENEAKEVSSREAMKRTVETSPYYPSWVKCAEEDLVETRKALLAKDLVLLGTIAERNAWRMHASILAAHSSILYLRPVTLAVKELVESLRVGGTPAFLTLDAGPNPVILCLAQVVPRITMRLAEMSGVERVVVAKPGPGIMRAERHVF